MSDLSEATIRARAISEVIDYVADLARLESLAGSSALGHWAVTRDILSSTYADERQLANIHKS